VCIFSQFFTEVQQTLSNLSLLLKYLDDCSRCTVVQLKTLTTSSNQNLKLVTNVSRQLRMQQSGSSY